MNKLRLIFTLTCLFSLFETTYASANIGLPMLIWAWPLFWLFLIPIIIIEYYVAKKYVKNVADKKLAYAVGLANVASTLIGIPLTWGILVALEISLLFLGEKTGIYTYLASLPSAVNLPILLITNFAWMPPFEQKPDTYLFIVAFLILLIPFFYASYATEYLFIKWLLKKEPLSLPSLAMGMWQANKASYLFLFFAGGITMFLLLYFS